MVFIAKSKLQIENFTGKIMIAIEQDFYARMYLANIVSIARNMLSKLYKKNTKKKIESLLLDLLGEVNA